jgi:hypothetical protein
VTPTDPAARIRALLAVPLDDRLRSIGARPVAVGWATVELDRAADELGAVFGVPPTRFVAATATRALGGRCRMSPGLLPDGVALVLIEPETEGRLAALLARHGEGPVALWFAVDDLPAAAARVRESGATTSAAGPGPFGPERLLLDGPIDGWHRLLIGPPGTIR